MSTKELSVMLKNVRRQYQADAQMLPVAFCVSGSGSGLFSEGLVLGLAPFGMSRHCFSLVGTRLSVPSTLLP